MTDAASTNPLIRIGELSRRTGVSADALRAWERRYRLLEPVRTEGGFRLYSPDDEARVRAMRGLIAAGVSASEAARMAREETALAGAGDAAADPAQATWRLQSALQRLDESDAHAVLDQLLATLSFEVVAKRVVLPVLRAVGDAWERGEITVAQEHFASNVVRARLLALARGWGAGHGPMAVLACPPGEQHDIGLIVFGLALRNQGWRITYLGSDTPVETIAATAEDVFAELIVIAALDADRVVGGADQIRDLSATQAVLLAGRGATATRATELGARHLPGDPVEAAGELAQLGWAAQP